MREVLGVAGSIHVQTLGEEARADSELRLKEPARDLRT